MNPPLANGLYKVPETVITELGKTRSQITNEQVTAE